MKTTREIGKKLEELVLAYLKEIDPTARLSRNSGASNDLADINCQDYYVECKKRNTASISINNKVWNHLLKQLPINTKKIPLLVLENKDKRRWVAMDLDDFFRLIKEEKND